MLISLLPLLSAAALAAPVEGLRWGWHEAGPQRWRIDNEVSLAGFMPFVSDRTADVRVVAFAVDGVYSCAVPERDGLSWKLGCTIDQIAVSAASLATDRGRLQPILDEMDAALTGSMVTLLIRPDGRLTKLELTAAPGRQAPSERMHDTLLLIVQQSLAGLNLELPESGYSAGGAWAQYETLLMTPPSVGVAGKSEIAHTVVSAPQAGVVSIDTRGRGAMEPASALDRVQHYDVTLTAATTFDLVAGQVVDRVWTVIGTPAVGSRGPMGVPYEQRGHLRRVGPQDRIAPGPSLELHPSRPRSVYAATMETDRRPVEVSWTLDRELRANLVCPRCRGELVDIERGLLCAADAAVFPVRAGVPWLVDEVALRATAEELGPT